MPDACGSRIACDHDVVETQATNDAGIIVLPDGRHLAVAVFVSDATADEATREGVIAAVARAAWDHWVHD